MCVCVGGVALERISRDSSVTEETSFFSLSLLLVRVNVDEPSGESKGGGGASVGKPE